MVAVIVITKKDGFMAIISFVRRRRVVASALAAATVVGLAALPSAPAASASAASFTTTFYNYVVTTGISSAPAIGESTYDYLGFYADGNVLKDVGISSNIIGKPASGVQTLATGISGTPVAANTYDHDLQVFYNNHGALEEDSWDIAGQNAWTGPLELATGITGNPSVTNFQPAKQTQMLYNHDGQLYDDIYNYNNGVDGKWTGPIAVGSPIIGSPSAIGDTLTGNLETYYDYHGNLEEYAWVASSKTWVATTLAPGITGTPSVAGFGDQLQIDYNHDGQLYQDTFTKGVGWSGPRAVGSPIIGSPIAFPAGSFFYIFYEYKDPARGNALVLATEAWSSSTGWTGPVDASADLPGLKGPIVPDGEDYVLEPMIAEGTYYVLYQAGNDLVACELNDVT
jgi:hypothetical protein